MSDSRRESLPVFGLETFHSVSLLLNIRLANSKFWRLPGCGLERRSVSEQVLNHMVCLVLHRVLPSFGLECLHTLEL